VRAASPRALLRAFRDMALVDREDENCGIVDDIEYREEQPGIWSVTALLVGPGAWQRRRPRWLTGILPGRRCVRVDAADIASTTNQVRLLKRGDELGLARVEHRLLRAWRKVPPIES
jgi:hypothetical protein